MKKKIKVGVIGATGMVGQNYLCLLNNHPWFEVTYLAASSRSAGKTYEEAVKDKWVMDRLIPSYAAKMMVGDAEDVNKAADACDIVFSAVSMDKNAVRELESRYARSGMKVVSNNSAHRSTKDVPVLIPEINHGHLEVIQAQRKNHNFGKGLIMVKPNCSIQSYMIPLHALIAAGYRVNRAVVTTMQAMSGAGYPGPAGLDMVDNVIPFISGEEEKTEQEPLKIFGSVENGAIAEDNSLVISAHCNRVPVIDGHMACVSIGFDSRVPGMDEVLSLWKNYKSYPVELKLPSAPDPAIIYREENNRPQPRKDRNSGNGMAVTVGRLRKCNVLNYRFTALSHNTVRGAAGGAILIAELIAAKGYID